MARAKRAHRAKPQRPRRGKSAPPFPEDPGGDVPPALEGLGPARRRESVQDPIGDWPETDAVTDQWLIERGRTEDPPDR
jgi:hypothetical protein